jgi:hypothetical protein
MLCSSLLFVCSFCSALPAFLLSLNPNLLSSAFYVLFIGGNPLLFSSLLYSFLLSLCGARALLRSASVPFYFLLLCSALLSAQKIIFCSALLSALLCSALKHIALLFYPFYSALILRSALLLRKYLHER